MDRPGVGPKGRVVDAVVWVAVIAVIVVLAGGTAWMLSRWDFELPALRVEEQTEDMILVEPVPPPVAQPNPTPATEPVTTVGPNGEVVRPPAWVRQPMPEYPELAMRRGIESGDVVLRCETLAAGEFGACEVVSETPRGAGFGEVALAATRQARVKPRSIDGFETDGMTQFTVRFRMAPEP